ncbi:hypothetical protein NT6N_24110 [Oceaniferula spumae]|uniref:Iron transporter n=1 Tax=Oceaniferula spumae TaxID=2979115 RepID=A0AAT9FN02_9BACT
MKATELLTYQSPVSNAACLKKRMLILMVSGFMAAPCYFLVGWLCEESWYEGILSSIIFIIGYSPALYSFMTGWVMRWKGIVYGMLLPQVFWMGVIFIVWLAARLLELL